MSLVWGPHFKGRIPRVLNILERPSLLIYDTRHMLDAEGVNGFSFLKDLGEASIFQ
jgi:hypothetical protein